MKIALLHLSPVLGDVEQNRSQIKAAVSRAAAASADWIITSELCICGYQFCGLIGTDWIQPQPDPWMAEFCQFVARLGRTVFLAHPERDRATDLLYNSVFVINASGEIVGKHRKRKVLRGAESWSSPGGDTLPVVVDTISVGLLICADAYTNDVAEKLCAQGAQLLISSAAWGPGSCGPGDVWEQRTSQTGLPLIVCNRTGEEPGLSFSGAESVVVKNGRRLLSFHSERSAVLLFDWDARAMEPVSQAYDVIDL